MSSNVTMNRKNRRKVERSKARQKQTAKLGAIGLATMLLAGATTGGAWAAETTIESGSVGKDWSDISYEEYEALGLTAADEKALNEQNRRARKDEKGANQGAMSGTTKFSMDPAEQARVEKDLGIEFDFAKTNKASDASVANYFDNSMESPLMQLSVKKTSAATAKEMNFDFIRDDYMTVGSTLPNIATASVFKPAKVEKGKLFPNYISKGVNVFDKNDHRYVASSDTFSMATLQPVSSIKSGGAIPHDSGETESESAYTIIQDNYSNGDSAAHLARINKSGNGHGPEISNCLVDSCSVWITAIDENGEALTDTFKIDVKTTVSAGSSDDLYSSAKPFASKTGGKIWFEQVSAFSYQGEDNEHYAAAAKLGPWSGASDFASYSKAMSGETTDVKIKNATTDANGVIKLEIGSVQNDFTLSGVQSTPKTGLLTMTSNGKNPVNVTDGEDEKLTVGQTLMLEDYSLKVTAIDSNEITFFFTKFSGTVPANVQTSHVNIGISSNLLFVNGDSWNLYGHVMKYTPGKKTPIVVVPKPVAKLDKETGAFGQPVNINVLTNDVASKGFTIQKSTLRLIDPVSKKTVKSVAVKAGTYVANSSGTVTFTPVKGFSGTATALGYSWQESNGTIVQSASSTVQAVITPVVKPKDPVEKPKTPKPATKPDVKTGAFGQPIDINVLTNDMASKGFTIQKSTLRLVNPVSRDVAKTVKVKEGTYVANSDGTVTFTPVKGFSGKASVIDYTWDETDGKLVQNASNTVQAIITPVVKPKDPVEQPKVLKPTTEIDAKTGKLNEVVTVDVLTNDAASKGESIEKDTLALIDPVSKKSVDTYTFKGQGTYEVKDAKVVFTPENNFDGKADALGYRWIQTDGQVADSTVQVTITPEVPNNDGGGDDEENDGGGEEMLNAGAGNLVPMAGAGFAGMFFFIGGGLALAISGLKNRFKRAKA